MILSPTLSQRHVSSVGIARFFYVMLVGLLMSSSAAVAQVAAQKNRILYEGKYALVVGNVNYREWPQLPGVGRDVEVIASYLESKGFYVEKIIDADSEALKAKITAFGQNYGYGENRALLYYFAGHGYTDLAFSDKKQQVQYGYYVPSDAPSPARSPKEFPKYGLSTAWFETITRDLRAKHIMLVFDSCFSGTLLEGGSNFELTEFCSDMMGEPTRQFITAGSAKQQVPDQSIFRKYFIEGLNGNADIDKDGFILGSELARYLYQNVLAESRGKQTPQYSKVKRTEYQLGEFIFPTGRPVQPTVFNRRCEALGAPRIAPADVLVAELKPIHDRLSEAIRNRDKVAIGSLIGDRFGIGSCGNAADFDRETALKILEAQTFVPNIVSIKRNQYVAEKVDDTTVKLTVLENYTNLGGASELYKATSIYKSFGRRWLARSFGLCREYPNRQE